MGRNKEDIQDRLTLQMEKISKRAEKRPEDLTLSEQLIKREAYDKLTVEQKRAAVPYPLWRDHLYVFMVFKKKITTNTLFKTLSYKFQKEMHEFHDSGCSFSDIVAFVEEKSTLLSNTNFK